MWLYGWKLLAEYHHPVTFCGHMHCGSGNVFNLFAWSHKTPWLIGHVILWVGTPQGKSPPCQDWWPQALWWWRYVLSDWRARFHMLTSICHYYSSLYLSLKLMIFQALVLKLQNIDIAFCQSIREVHRVLVPSLYKNNWWNKHKALCVNTQAQ